MSEEIPAQIIKAGTLVLLTGGEYSDFGVMGLFRATVDTPIPMIKVKYSRHQMTIDPHALSLLLEEVPYETHHYVDY